MFVPELHRWLCFCSSEYDLFTPYLPCSLSYTLLFNKVAIQVLFFCVSFSFILLCCSISFAPVLHLPGLFNLMLNEHFTFLLLLSPSLPFASFLLGASCNSAGLEQNLRSPSPFLVYFSWSCKSSSLCLLLLSNLSLLWRASPWAFCIESIGLEASWFTEKEMDELIMLWYFHKLTSQYADYNMMA